MHNLMIYLSFSFFLLLFVVVGLMSKMQSKPTSHDYLLANKQIKPWLAALSAVATNNSGYMFIGMIGYTYTVGLASIWLAVGWIVGDFIASLFIHQKLRENIEVSGAQSFPSMISNWDLVDFIWVRRLAAIIVIIFLGTYAAAQLNAGSKALHVLFNWHYATGALIGALIVLIYCYAGGIRASIWTDVAQSFVMIIAMAAMCYMSYKEIGSLSTIASELRQISPTYFNLFTGDLMFGVFWGPVLFAIGWLFAGFSVVGQPHIMVRFMALDDSKNIFKVRLYYYTWYIIFFILTILVGIAARLLIKESNFDAELALPMLAMQMFPAPVIGLILAGLFAATMSTADSQILSCAASLTKDFFKLKDTYWFNKAATLGVTILALIIALSGNKNVFYLVVFAWAVLGASFAPLLALYALKQKVSQGVACLMILSGMICVLIWSQFEVSNTLYSACPGILTGFLIYFVAKLFIIQRDRPAGKP